MSIIEKTLDMQRGSCAADHDRRREAFTSRPDASRDRRSPRALIDIDFAALRANGIVPPEQAAKRISEQFRRIKWPLLESVAGSDASAEVQAANVLMITSSIADEGKTFTSFNLALSIAHEKDFEVLLADADIAKRHLTRALKAEDRPGLTDAVAGAAVDPEDCVLGTGIPGLSFLPAGCGASSAPELFSCHRMADIIGILRQGGRQRIVLLDSSPLLETNESQLLARLVDQIVLVVRAEWTPQPMVLEAIGLLGRNRQIRCVLNQVQGSHMTEYYYGYGYPARHRDASAT